MKKNNLKYIVLVLILMTANLKSEVLNSGYTGLCQIQIKVLSTGYQNTYEYSQYYSSLPQCQSTIQVLCKGKFVLNALYEYAEALPSTFLHEKHRPNFKDSGGMTSARWGCVARGHDPKLNPELKYKPIPLPVTSPFPGWDNYQGSPSIQPVPVPTFNPLNVIKDIWNFCVENSSKIDVQTWLALIAIFVGLGLLKSGEFAISGPGALEPMSAMAAIALLLVLLDPYMTDVEKKRFESIDTTSVEIINEDAKHLVYEYEEKSYELKQDNVGNYVFEKNSTHFKNIENAEE